MKSITLLYKWLTGGKGKQSLYSTQKYTVHALQLCAYWATEALDPADYRESKLCKTQFDVNYVLHHAKFV